MLTLSQAPNRKPNDVNHTEPELFLQALNEKNVRISKANRRRLEFLVLHDSNFAIGALACRCGRALRTLRDS